MAATPITWNDGNTAVSLLEPLIDPSVGYIDNILVRCDPTNCHYQGGPRFRLGRFSIDSGGHAVWHWLESDNPTGPGRLYCVDAFALAEAP